MKTTLPIVGIVAIAALVLAPAPSASEPSGVVISHQETLDVVAFGRERFDTSREAGAPGRRSVAFDALGRRFELELQSNERLLARALHGRVSAGIGVYRGRLAGREDSWVRLVVANGMPSGLIWDGVEMHAIEAREGASGAATPVIFRLRDVYVEPGSMTCGSGGHRTAFATVLEDLESELKDVVTQAAGANRELNIGLVADYEFSQRMGANVEAELLTRINNVDGIFSEQLGVQITANEIETFTAPNDPFTTSVAGDLLDEVSAYRAQTPAQNSQGITFLFTGRGLDGTTVGIAYLYALCSRQFGVGLAEGLRGTTTDSLIAAHEIGHIFGAEHDGEAGSVCESVTGTFLMAPRVSSTDQFSSCSLDTMRPLSENGSCINPLPQTDVAIALTNTPSNLLLGASTDLVFNVPNAGTQNANNVAATFDVPAILTVDSVATTVGSCSSGGGRVNCVIGTLAGGGSASIALSVTASTVGSATLDASVVADGDANPGDNSQAVSIVVSSATDLRIVNAASRSVTLNSPVAISPRVENISSVAATNPVVTLSFAAGLRVDSASWPNGTCSVGAGSVTCQRANLAAGSSASLDIQFTATAAGSQAYSASVSASEADANSSDNSASGTVTVSGGGGGGSDSGGGGAFGLLWALLVASISVALRARRP